MASPPRCACGSPPSEAGRAGLPVQGRAPSRRDGDAEQRARDADRRPRPGRAHPLFRRGAALRAEVHPPRGAGRRQPAAGGAAADGRQQVPPPRRRRCRSPARRIPEDARGALRVPRADSRQHRGRRLHRRSAAHDCGLRREARRRPADARRPAGVRGGQLHRNAGRRRAAGRPRASRPRRSTPVRSRD